MAFWALPISASGIHVLSKSSYPFHFTKYCLQPLTIRASTTFSISYSSPESTRIYCSRITLPQTGFSWDTWNTSCILQSSGNSNLYATEPMHSYTFNGPAQIGASFLVPSFKGRFFVASHTESPTSCDISRLLRLATRSIRDWASWREVFTCSWRSFLADTKLYTAGC